MPCCGRDFDDPDPADPVQAKWIREGQNKEQQPALTRTCRNIRKDALKSFYQLNSFEGCYCEDGMRVGLLKWLRAIGEQNRATMRYMYVWDLSSDYFDEDLDFIRRLLTEIEAEVELCAGGEARYRINFGASPSA